MRRVDFSPRSPRLCVKIFILEMTLPNFSLRILESAADLAPLEDLQRLVWPGNETEIVPLNLLRAAVHAGGVAIGAFAGGATIGTTVGASRANQWDTVADMGGSPLQYVSPLQYAASPLLVGFVFGFPGLYHTPTARAPNTIRTCSLSTPITETWVWASN